MNAFYQAINGNTGAPPHTPQHNASVERAQGDLKCAAEMDESALHAAERGHKTLVVNTGGDLEVLLAASRHVPQHVPRLRLGGFTSGRLTA